MKEIPSFCMNDIHVREYRRVIKNGQSRETRTYGTQDEEKQNERHNATCVGHHYAQTNTK
jgi:hypothetical protein